MGSVPYDGCYDSGAYFFPELKHITGREITLDLCRLYQGFTDYQSCHLPKSSTWNFTIETTQNEFYKGIANYGFVHQT